MADYAEETGQIRETDIVFDCPYCGKSLAIDYRGAGLNVKCTDCGRNVQVPIPEGIDIADLDSTREEQEIRIVNLRRSLTATEERVRELEAELEPLRSRRAALESIRSEDKTRLGAIRNAMGVIKRAHEEMMTALEAVADALPEANEKSGRQG